MSLLRVLIADDEPMGRQRLSRMLRAESDVELVAACANGAEALEAIRRHGPDLAFIDIQMPGLDGFGVVDALEHDRAPSIVFVTAHDYYAVRAFEVHALDYLLKPFDQTRLHAALNRAREQLPAHAPGDAARRMIALLEELNQRQKGELGLERLVIRTPERTFFLRTEAIDWIEAAGKHVHLHVGKATHPLRGGITALEHQLDPARFVRISRSAIVNIDRIQEIQPWFQGDHLVILQDRTRLTSTRGYREGLQRLLGRENGGRGEREKRESVNGA